MRGKEQDTTCTPGMGANVCTLKALEQCFLQGGCKAKLPG